MAVVRKVELEDLSAIEAAYPISEGTPGNPHRKAYELHQAGDTTWLVAWEGDRPCDAVTIDWPRSRGHVSRWSDQLGCTEIGGLEVDEDMRGRGIGRALMAMAEAQVRERGVERLGLEVTATNPQQDAARALYTKLGFADAGVGEFISGYTYWTADGKSHRDEEPHRYLIKRLTPQ